MTTGASRPQPAGLRALDRFRKVNETFPKTDEILEYKAQGKKVFGWLCTYAPEEIIHAAGALPIRITGYSHETDLEDGTAYFYHNNCSFSRSCLQLGLKGEYDFLDGVVGGSTCDGARRVFDLWHAYVGTPFHHVLTVPRKYTERAHRLYHDQVVQFQRHLEEFLGFCIADADLLRSVDLFNESRQLLRDLYEFRKLQDPPISGAETMEVLNASFHMPKELFNQWLAGLLDELSTSPRRYGGRARLMITGSITTNPEFLRSIEDAGGLIVTDELCNSTRYWSDPVLLDGYSTPLQSISRRYLNNFPCARMFPSDERFDRILALARDFRVDGVISQIIRYCVPYAHDLPLITEKLNEAGIPTLALDVEYGTSGSGQIHTRVQAFLEMLESRRQQWTPLDR